MPQCKKCVVVKYTNGTVDWNDDRDIWYEDLVANQPTICECEPMDAEDPPLFFIHLVQLENPKGLHTTGGYLLGAHLSFKYIFGYEDGDVYWCTADVGWITGHTYILYGPFKWSNNTHV